MNALININFGLKISTIIPLKSMPSSIRERHRAMTASQVRWNEGSFVRDTLIYRFGILVRAVAITAFAEPKVKVTYDAWQNRLKTGEALEPTASETLIKTGFATGGNLQLAARQEADEFLVICQHDHFQATICVGFDTQAMMMQGLFVAHFEGNPYSALSWVDAITRHIASKPPPVDPALSYQGLAQLMHRCN